VFLALPGRCSLMYCVVTDMKALYSSVFQTGDLLRRPCKWKFKSTIVCCDCVLYSVVVLCDTRDTSILIVDTYVTIPVSPKSRYTAVYRSSKKYCKTAQVSRVSTIPRVSYVHWATSSLKAYDVTTNVIKSLTVKHCASSSHLVNHHYTAHLWVAFLSRNDWLRNQARGQRTRTLISKTSVDLKFKSIYYHQTLIYILVLHHHCQ